ncbi:hypothetical protein HU200_013675 [Digitaria exilis]|uniref:Uncharacterized protein n=1 Tax=Digitaria exilis TaxID=1010633 RepID=A0A835FCT1_9POAL|nr:hypothetical protein HU200_013675 [Digitaria exilis]
MNTLVARYDDNNLEMSMAAAEVPVACVTAGAEHRRFPGIKRVQLLKNWQFYPLARDWVPYGKGSIPNGARTFPPVEEDAAVARHPPQSARRGRNVEVGTKRANSLPYPTLRRKPSTGGVRWNWRNLRLAPDDPVSLVRAAAVCPRWRRVRHRTAPMLGFFANIRDDNNYTFLARFVPATRFRPPRADLRHHRALDARHGRVLLVREPWHSRLEVWDPVTDDLHKLPRHARVRLLVGVWRLEQVDLWPSSFPNIILKYDLAAQSVSKIHLPRRFISDFIVLTTTEDGLGFAVVEKEQLIELMYPRVISAARTSLS